MPLDSVQVVNASLQLIAAQKRIASLSDPGTVAQSANLIYQPTVQLLLRDLDPAFARITVALNISAGTAPPPWAYAYTYPADCVRLRQVRPPGSGPGALADINDPGPIRANVAVLPGTPPAKVILTSQQNALGVYTTASVTEAAWDFAFYDAMVRRLANPLAMALSGRPDFARSILQEAGMAAQIAESVDEGGLRRTG